MSWEVANDRRRRGHVRRPPKPRPRKREGVLVAFALGVAVGIVLGIAATMLVSS